MAEHTHKLRYTYLRFKVNHFLNTKIYLPSDN